MSAWSKSGAMQNLFPYGINTLSKHTVINRKVLTVMTDLCIPYIINPQRSSAVCIGEAVLKAFNIDSYFDLVHIATYTLPFVYCENKPILCYVHSHFNVNTQHADNPFID